ncbi:MAG: CRISPR system precrRNA processing endoribonuclease RAMP protein Cas6 [Candidatus Obscuribacterales bacterium]|nr:CRISPR system precrRNA processing endoribonuclease RAMP protein Cas6 [Candidatus Obscuribacterales bacterium]
MEIRLFEFDLLALSTLHLSEFSAPSLRGGLGSILRELTCVTRLSDCTDCPVRKECPFTSLFNSQVDEDAHFHKGAQVPRPFVLSAPIGGRLSHGEHFKFRLTMVGEAVEYLPYMVLAYRQLGMQGLGKGRGKYKLVSVSSLDPIGGHLPKRIFDHDEDVLYPSRCYEVSFDSVCDWAARTNAPHRLEVHLATPAHLVSGGSRLREAPQFEQLMRAVLRRYSDLCALYSTGRPNLNYSELLEEARHVTLESYQLREMSARGFSSRRQQPTPRDGISGTLTYSGNLKPFLPHLMLGQWLHIGKQATFGMGRYDLQIVA